ncbi:MAG: hypothetical protein QXT64_00140 [Desulfurococcaceae archaeon]|uniref:Structural protein with a triple beta-helix fold n=1 Tax=Ligamenvirales sp. TaxID=2832923 RepID=A0AAU6PXC7_9VIRU
MSIYPPTVSAKEVWEYPQRTLNYMYGISPTDDILLSDTTLRYTNSTSPVKMKEMLLFYGGVIRTYFEMYAASGYRAYGRVYINDKPYGTLRSTTSTTPVAFTEDLYFPPNSFYQIYGYSSSSSAYAYYPVQSVRGVITLISPQPPIVGFVTL